MSGRSSSATAKLAAAQVERRPVRELRPHPQAGAVPALSARQYAAVKADVAARGLRVPLEITAQGLVLDGHGRLRAALELGIDEIEVQVVAPQDELEHILRAALLRRQLSASQRAALPWGGFDRPEEEHAGRRRREASVV